MRYLRIVLLGVLSALVVVAGLALALLYAPDLPTQYDGLWTED